MNATEFIIVKRDGGEHRAEELGDFFRGYLRGEVKDYHVAAWLMAAYERGLSVAERVALTRVIRESGGRLDLGGIGAPKVDKHSTGGVGDKTSLVLTPLIAAMGACVPMMSGRGLGHTGGTLDKLESIPGIRVQLAVEEVVRILERHGGVFMGQTEEIAPLDRALYALRDVTGTVESVGLITASIIGKKACEDLDGLVLDVKWGRGAFMRTVAEARMLAQSLVETARECGICACALITDMNEPLGQSVGNAVEVEEALMLLRGEKVDERLWEVTLRLAEEMCRAVFDEEGGEKWREKLEGCLRSGRAYERFEEIIAAQGVSWETIRQLPGSLPRAPERVAIRARGSGVVCGIDTYRLGRLLAGLGAGRVRVSDAIDPAIGLYIYKHCGEEVRAGEAVAELCVRGSVETKPFEECFEVGEGPVEERQLIVEEVR
ncbi:MAG: thymidine phosphorylase [bacterium]|nr:thymidine phosphorylase [bacterium]